MTTTFPSDLLLALTDATAQQGDLQGLLKQHALLELAPLFNVEGLHDALDTLLDGIAQYPFQPQADSNDVCEWQPRGRVYLDDKLAATTLRGYLWALAFGNAVTIRTARPSFWSSLDALLRQRNWPLPTLVAAAPGAALDAIPLHVPDLSLPAEHAHHPELFVATAENTLALRPAVDLPISTLLAKAWQFDLRHGWLGQLYQRVFLPATTLAQARTQAGAEQAQARVDARLRYLVQQAKRTEHYRRLPDIHSTAQLGQLPILDKATLDVVSLPMSRQLSSNALPTGEVLRSGATSGQPRYIVYSQTDWNNMIREAIPLFYALGLAKGDRLINTLYGGSMYGGLITTVCEFSRMPLETYSTGQFISVDDLLMLTERFSANAILGMPALILPLLREAKAKQPDLQIEKVLYGGTPMAEADKAWLREHLGTKTISSVLAANDGAQIGYQCSHMSGTRHHLCDEYNLVEIVDDDGQPVADGEPGHILITTLQKQEGPLIRYRIGDYGRVLHHACPCGTTGRVLDYVGRSDGLIRVQGNTVLYSELIESLKDFGVSQLQVEVLTRNAGECMIIRVESPLKVNTSAMHAHLLAQFPVLQSGTEFHDSVGPAFELEVEGYAEGELPRNSVSGKIKPVIDRRV